MGKTPVWLVEITIPKKLIQEITKGSLELESETIEAEDIDQSYEEGLDDKMYQTPQDQGGGAPAPAAPYLAPAISNCFPVAFANDPPGTIDRIVLAAISPFFISFCPGLVF